MTRTSGILAGERRRRNELLFWIFLFAVLGVTVHYYSRHQPFPEISGKFAWLLMMLAALLWLSNTAPREMGEWIPPVMATTVGGLGVIYGVIQMSMTDRDVVVAPFSGMLLCVGAIDLMVSRWDGMGGAEQIGSFIVASILVALEIYLIFRGLVVGIKGVSWSKSGLRQIRRGLIHGPRGAISHFERSWDMEDPWINAMSHAALALIHRHTGDSESEREHLAELEREGGWDSIDGSWVEAIEEALRNVDSVVSRHD